MKKNELKIGIFLSLLVLIINFFIQIIYTPMYVKYLGTSDYGIMSLVRSLINYVGILNLGMSSTIIKYTVKYRMEKKESQEAAVNGLFMIIFIIISIIASLILTYIYFKIPMFFKETFTILELNKTRKIFIIMSVNLILSFPMIVFSSNIISREKFIYQKSLRLIINLSNPLIGIFLMISGYGLIPVVLSMTIVNLVSYFFDLIYALKLGIKFKIKGINFRILKEILEYSFFIFINILIDNINWEVDNLILAKYRGSLEVGIYSISRVFNSFYMQLSVAISSVLFPKINKLVNENKNRELKEMFFKIGRIQYFLLMLLLSGFILLGKDFIYLWLGEGYEIVYRILLLVMIPLTIPLIQNTGLGILRATNKHKFRSVVYGIIAILNIFISIILVKNYGILGCAFGTSLSFVVGNIVIMNIYYHKVIKIDMILFWKNILQMTIPVFIAMVFGYCLNKYFTNINILNFLIKGILYSLVYIVLMWKISLNEYEKKELLNPIFKIFNKLKNK